MNLEGSYLISKPKTDWVMRKSKLPKIKICPNSKTTRQRKNVPKFVSTPLIIFIWLAAILERFGPSQSRFLDFDPLGKNKTKIN